MKRLLWAVMLLAVGMVRAGNPIIQNQGVCDPHIRIYDGRAWLYASQDYSVSNPTHDMRLWWVWSSADLVNWTMENCLRPETTHLNNPNFRACWATDSATRNGKYYWYYSVSMHGTGVVVGDTPRGPWSESKPIHFPGAKTKTYDPGILMDDGGTNYIIVGAFDYYIARLGDDMMSLAEPPRLIEIAGKRGPYGEGKTDDKPYLHKRNGKYYLSWGCYYAMADNPYGPYTYKGVILVKDRIAPAFQQPAMKCEDGGWVHDRHGSFFEFNNQWYFACNTSSGPGCAKFFRGSVMGYVHYRDNGEIEPVYIEEAGVGQYDAAQGRVEAENYFSMSNVVKRQCPAGGFEIGGVKDGSYLYYPRVYNLPGKRITLSFRVSSVVEGATIEVRARKLDGSVLTKCVVPKTDDWATYQTVAVPFGGVEGQADLYLVFKGPGEELLRLDWMEFEKEK